MTKLINGRKLSKSLKVIFKSFPGSKIQDMKHYTKPALQQKPDKVILHVGTNNIKKDTPQRNQKEISRCSYWN